MREASFFTYWSQKNNIFTNDKEQNRDNTLAPYIRLKEEFLKHGVDLKTRDLCSLPIKTFEIHQDVSSIVNEAPTYLINLETAEVKPDNWKISNLSKYKKIFTWNDDLIDNENIIKINFPNEIAIEDDFIDYERRKIDFVLIAGNKTLRVKSPHDLYSERVRIIKYLEKEGYNFHLYGHGWSNVAAKSDFLNKLTRLLLKYTIIPLGFKNFKSYRGSIKHKKDILRSAKFCICYENVSGYNGYITEKIIDSFMSGCVPVYWGANNITDHIPSSTFVDRRNFASNKDLVKYLNNIEENEYTKYQQNIRQFLTSEKVYKFSSEYFAATIVDTIVKDISL